MICCLRNNVPVPPVDAAPIAAAPAVPIAAAPAAPIAAAPAVPIAVAPIAAAPDVCLTCGQEGHLRRSHRDCPFNRARYVFKMAVA